MSNLVDCEATSTAPGNSNSSCVVSRMLVIVCGHFFRLLTVSRSLECHEHLLQGMMMSCFFGVSSVVAIVARSLAIASAGFTGVQTDNGAVWPETAKNEK